MSQFLKPLELSPPKYIEGSTSSNVNEPIPVTIEGNVFEMIIYNKSLDYNIYVSFDYGDTYIKIEPDHALRCLFGSLPDPLILIKSDGANVSYEIIYRLRLD